MIRSRRKPDWYLVTRGYHVVIALGALGIALFLLSTSASALTTVPTKMNFQGRLTDASGNIKPNGTYNMKLKLYTVSTAGSSVWSEDRLVSATQGVTVTNGLFSVKLGDITTLPASLFASGELYLEVELPTPATATSSTPTWTEGPMTPRNQMATSAYAYNAETIDGIDSANLAQLDANNTFGGNTIFTGTLQGNSSLTLGTASAQGSLVVHDGNGQTATLRVADTAGNYTYTLPVVTANDTFCMLTLGNCGGSLTVGALDGGTANANGATITSGVLYLQSASATNAGLVSTGTQTFAGNKTFNGTLAVNDVSVAAGKSITIVGGNTASRPASPVEGMVYYDTTTKQLLTYANAKWQADRSTSTKIVGMGGTTGCSGSLPVASQSPDGADYVVTSCTSAQTAINSAITALPAGGGTVYLMEGTYIVDGTITIPSNVTLSGAGRSTILKLKDAINADINLLSVGTTSRVAIQNLKLDGNKANNTAGAQVGISLGAVGSGSGATAVPGVAIDSMELVNFRADGIKHNSGTLANSSISRVSAITNSGSGFLLFNSAVNLSITDNISHGNTQIGMDLFGLSNSTVSANTISGNSQEGIKLAAAGNVVSGNTITSNVTGINVGSSNNVISGNTIASNTGNGISITSSSHYNTVTDNYIASNTASGVGVGSSDRSTITSNTIKSNTGSAVSLDLAQFSLVSNNNMYDNGSTAATSSILLSAGCCGGSNDNRVIDNSITDTAGTGYAISITNGSRNYLSGNTYSGTGAASINDAGVSTVYANQLDATGNLINRSPGGFSVGKTTAGTTFDLQGAIRNAVLPTPAAATLSTSGTAGSTTYGYRVAALDGLGETLASTETTIATGNATLTAGNYINITWTQVSGAVQYKIYRSTSAGTPATTGLIRTLASNVLTTTDTGIAASGAVATSNTTGQASFGGAIQGGSSLTLGTTTVAGSLVISDGSSNTATISVGSLAGNYTYAIPVTTANDTFCLVTLANCYTAPDGGVTTVGTYSTTNTNATGATISGNTITFQDASATAPGMVGTGTQTFAGNKTFSGDLTVQNVTLASSKNLKITSGYGTVGEAPLAISDSIYATAATTFAPVTLTGGATTVVMGDETVSSAITLPFNFNFYNKTYSTFKITDNGYIGFGDLIASYEVKALPHAEVPDAFIAGYWADLDPSSGGTIKYETFGTSPNRKVVVEYASVPEYANITSTLTTQIILYEGSNNIEVHTTGENISGLASQGIESQGGGFASYLAGRSQANFTLTNDAVRFTFTQPTVAVAAGDFALTGVLYAGDAITVIKNSNGNVLSVSGGQTALGQNSLLVSTGSSNTAVGVSSLRLNTTGSSNTATGAFSLQANTTGSSNTATGAFSLQANTTGYNNTSNGTRSLSANTTGYSNTATGAFSLQANTTGFRNTASGTHSLYSNTTGNLNTASGNYSLYSNTTGTQNTASGDSSLYANTTGSSNTANGYNTLTANTTGSQNTASGSYSLNSNTTGNKNTASGTSSLEYNTTGFNNTASGSYSLQSNSSGSNNTASGAYALNTNTVGANNVGIGYDALTSLKPLAGTISAFASDGASGTRVTVPSTTGLSNGTSVYISGTTNYNGVYTISSLTGTTFDLASKAYTTNDATGLWRVNSQGDANTAVGASAGAAYTCATSCGFTGNTLLGYQAGYSLQTGADYNVLMGFAAGNDITTGARNIAIGYNIDTSSATASDELNIGNIVYGNISQTAANRKVYIKGDNAAVFQVQNAAGAALLTVNGATGQTTLGTTTIAGSLVISDGSSNNATIVVGNLAGNYSYTIPVTTANDTFCLVTLANCAGGGVSTVGALDGGTANANGATITGSVLYLQAASATNPGLVNTTTQTFAGNKTFSGNLVVSGTSSFTGQVTVGVADTTGILLVLDTKTDAGDPTGTAGAMYYNSSLGKFRCYQGVAWTDCIGAGGPGGGLTRKISLAPEYPGAVLTGTGSGTLTSDYDSTNVRNYYGWTGSTGSQTTYSVVVRNAIPSDYASGFGTVKLWVYNASTSTANNNIQVSIRDADGGALCATDTSVINTTATSTWEEKAVAISGCTFAANDIITVTIKLTGNSTNAVRIGELSYQYTN